MEIQITFTSEEIRELLVKRADELIPAPTGSEYVARCKYSYLPEVVVELVDKVNPPKQMLPLEVPEVVKGPASAESQSSEEVAF